MSEISGAVWISPALQPLLFFRKSSNILFMLKPNLLFYFPGLKGSKFSNVNILFLEQFYRKIKQIVSSIINTFVWYICYN